MATLPTVSGLDKVLREAFPTLPKNIVSLEIRMAVDEVATVKCVFYLDKETIDQLVPVLAEFELYAKKPPDEVRHQ